MTDRRTFLEAIAGVTSVGALPGIMRSSPRGSDADLTTVGYVNPRDPEFGAAGDGMSDDTGAIQAAIDTGHPVYLPSGTYRVHTLRWSGDNRVLRGAGWDTKLKPWAATRTLIEARNHPHLTIENLRLDCDGIADTAIDVGWDSPGLSAQSQFRAIHITGTPRRSATAFIADNNHDSVFEHIVVTGMGTAGLAFRLNGGAGAAQLSSVLLLDGLLELNVQYALLNNFVGCGIRIADGGGSNNLLNLNSCYLYSSRITGAALAIPPSARCQAIRAAGSMFVLTGTDDVVLDGTVEQAVLCECSTFELGTAAAVAAFASSRFPGSDPAHPLVRLVGCSLQKGIDFDLNRRDCTVELSATRLDAPRLPEARKS